jgi:hypothetical protein
MIGLRYARLTVLGSAGIKNNRGMLLCRCECGAEKVIEARRVRKGLTKSCGCLSREISKSRHRRWNILRGSSPLDSVDEDIIQ